MVSPVLKAYIRLKFMVHAENWVVKPRASVHCYVEMPTQSCLCKDFRTDTGQLLVDCHQVCLMPLFKFVHMQSLVLHFPINGRLKALNLEFDIHIRVQFESCQVDYI